MRIAIIGAGAMGCLYGGKLSAVESNTVFLLDVWEEHVAAINKGGLYMKEEDRELHYNGLRASTDAREIGVADLVLIFVKSTLTGQAVAANKSVFGPETIVLTLQNGLGNIDLIGEEVGLERVIAGTTAHGATMLGPGQIRHAGSGQTIIGELDGRMTPRLEDIRMLFEQAGMEAKSSDNITGLIWDKLMVNVGINALTGITHMKNGVLPQSAYLTEILELAVTEAKTVAQAKGVNLGYEDPVAHTLEVAKATAENKSSMLQDILGGKKTEINMINGAIVREGQVLGIPTPANKILTNLISFFEQA